MRRNIPYLRTYSCADIWLRKLLKRNSPLSTGNWLHFTFAQLLLVHNSAFYHKSIRESDAMSIEFIAIQFAKSSGRILSWPAFCAWLMPQQKDCMRKESSPKPAWSIPLSDAHRACWKFLHKSSGPGFWSGKNYQAAGIRAGKSCSSPRINTPVVNNLAANLTAGHQQPIWSFPSADYELLTMTINHCW